MEFLRNMPPIFKGLRNECGRPFFFLYPTWNLNVVFIYMTVFTDRSLLHTSSDIFHTGVKKCSDTHTSRAQNVLWDI